MAIPYNDHLSWASYGANPQWHKNLPELSPDSTPIDREMQVRRVLNVFKQTPKQLVVRGIQFIRDAARLVLKVPIRAIKTPIILEKNWKELERAKVNAKLTGYSFVQLVSVPVKFLVALAALVTLAISLEGAKWLLDKSKDWTIHIDGRASQLEALKEEGRNASSPEEHKKYKDWLYSFDPKLCRKTALIW